MIARWYNDMESREERIGIVNQSYQRCLRHDNFFTFFYSHFTEQSDEIAALFANTDWYTQKQLIERAIRAAILYAKEPDMPIVHSYMENIAKRHSKRHLDIRPALYPLWLDSLIEAVSLCDPEYTAELGNRWREVLAPAINLMTENYKGNAIS